MQKCLIIGSLTTRLRVANYRSQLTIQTLHKVQNVVLILIIVIVAQSQLGHYVDHSKICASGCI